MTLYKNKYRSGSIRLKNWDYSNDACYFVTICTKNKENFFGEIVNKEMILSSIGKIAYQNWLEIPNHFENIEIDEFIIMSNHIHGIIFINKKTINVDTCHGMYLQQQNKQNQFSKPVKNSQYKESVKRYCNKNNISFEWQSKFYEHIVRNEKSFNNIKQYIKNNPLNWSNDTNNEKNN